MGLRIRTAVCLLGVGLLGPAAWADCEIDNRDDRDYKVSYKIVGSGSSTETTIAKNTSNNQTTGGDIEITVEGVGRITAGNNDPVINNDGRLTKARQ